MVAQWQLKLLLFCSIVTMAPTAVGSVSWVRLAYFACSTFSSRKIDHVYGWMQLATSRLLAEEAEARFSSTVWFMAAPMHHIPHPRFNMLLAVPWLPVNGSKASSLIATRVVAFLCQKSGHIVIHMHFAPRSSSMLGAKCGSLSACRICALAQSLR